jgi:hypothetical protein
MWLFSHWLPVSIVCSLGSRSQSARQPSHGERKQKRSRCRPAPLRPAPRPPSLLSVSAHGARRGLCLHGWGEVAAEHEEPGRQHHARRAVEAHDAKGLSCSSSGAAARRGGRRPRDGAGGRRSDRRRGRRGAGRGRHEQRRLFVVLPPGAPATPRLALAGGAGGRSHGHGARREIFWLVTHSNGLPSSLPLFCLFLLSLSLSLARQRNLRRTSQSARAPR